MDLESLLNANLELQRRIATDRKMRDYFSRFWPDFGEPKTSKPAPPAPDDKTRQLTFTFPVEMCELLAREVERTGKSPSQILEDAFVDYFVRSQKP